MVFTATLGHYRSVDCHPVDARARIDCAYNLRFVFTWARSLLGLSAEVYANASTTIAPLEAVSGWCVARHRPAASQELRRLHLHSSWNLFSDLLVSVARLPWKPCQVLLPSSPLFRIRQSERHRQQVRRRQRRVGNMFDWVDSIGR